MQKNESSLDCVLRLVLGIAVLSLAFVGPKSPWALLGLIPIATAVVGFCPLYRLVGITTCHTPQQHGA